MIKNEEAPIRGEIRGFAGRKGIFIIIFAILHSQKRASAAKE